VAGGGSLSDDPGHGVRCRRLSATATPPIGQGRRTLGGSSRTYTNLWREWLYEHAALLPTLSVLGYVSLYPIHVFRGDIAPRGDP
jgi:hypothetical protein